MQASSIAPLSKKQLNVLDCRFNSPTARMVLRGRGQPSDGVLRFLNRLQTAAERVLDGTGDNRVYMRGEDPREARAYEAALRLRNERRAARTVTRRREVSTLARNAKAYGRPRVA